MAREWRAIAKPERRHFICREDSALVRAFLPRALTGSAERTSAGYACRNKALALYGYVTKTARSDMLRVFKCQYCGNAYYICEISKVLCMIWLDGKVIHNG